VPLLPQLFLKVLYLQLLLRNAVEKYHGYSVILHSFNLTLRVVSYQQRFGLLYVFRSETQVTVTAVPPCKRDRT